MPVSTVAVGTDKSYAASFILDRGLLWHITLTTFLESINYQDGGSHLQRPCKLKYYFIYNRIID